MRSRRPHRLRLARSSRSERPARRRVPGSRQQCGASSSPQKLLSGTHGVDDDDHGDALNVANLESKGSSVGSREHGETISHVPGPDGVVIGVKDVSLAQAVLQRRSGNDRIVHRSKITCDVLCGRGLCLRGGAGGCRRFDRPVSVRMPQMCWLTSVSSGALMRARLVDSEKSSIMTLSAVCGAGWADRERTFAARTAFSHRTRGWDLSHLQEIAVLAGYRSSRCAAGGCAALA